MDRDEFKITILGPADDYSGDPIYPWALASLDRHRMRKPPTLGSVLGWRFLNGLSPTVRRAYGD